MISSGPGASASEASESLFSFTSEFLCLPNLLVNLHVPYNPSSGIDFSPERALVVLSVRPSTTGATTVIVTNVRVRSIVIGLISFLFFPFFSIKGTSSPAKRLGGDSISALVCAAMTHLAKLNTEFPGISVDMGREVSCLLGPIVLFLRRRCVWDLKGGREGFLQVGCRRLAFERRVVLPEKS